MVKKDGNFPFLINDKQLIAGGKWVKLSISAASAHFGSDLLRQALIIMCVCWILSYILQFVGLLEFELMWPSINVAFPSKTKTLRHFPVMQQNILNPDITVSGYTFDDDSACVT